MRTPTREISVGNVKIGGNNPIVVQSMTNTKTCDVEGSVNQCIQLAEAGCQIIRLTAQNLDAAKALKFISQKFRAAGFSTPLVADIHFLPATAMEAVEHVEKIRVNPGNFTDKKLGKTEYTDLEYEEELEKIRKTFTPLVLRCKELGRALRIGTNHGSLSERIICRYGDTSYGMVEAAFEFARICRDLDFHNFCFSFKASNTRIMTQTYRLAVKRMAEEGFSYPLHLGVTEAGFGTDARIKSAMGIGGLLFDGIGDTIRVSLTEDPVAEVPVAREIARLAESVRRQSAKTAPVDEGIDYLSYNRRETFEIDLGPAKAGSNNVPVAATTAKSKDADISFENGLSVSNGATVKLAKYDCPKALAKDLSENAVVAAQIDTDKLPSFADAVRNAKNLVFVSPAQKDGRHALGEARLWAAQIKAMGLKNPLWIKFDAEKLADKTADELSKLNEASIYIGGLLVDGIGDIASADISPDAQKNAQYTLAILQGARARRSKAEYIACPSCGRTLYNIQDAVAKIEKATSHLKDVTIAVMGCIVNGPGEMADADFGYVGGAPGKINLYKGKKCIEVNIPQEKSIERLVEFIKAEGKWTEPETKK